MHRMFFEFSFSMCKIKYKKKGDILLQTNNAIDGG